MRSFIFRRWIKITTELCKSEAMRRFDDEFSDHQTAQAGRLHTKNSIKPSEQRL